TRSSTGPPSSWQPASTAGSSARSSSARCASSPLPFATSGSGPAACRAGSFARTRSRSRPASPSSPSSSWWSGNALAGHRADSAADRRRLGGLDAAAQPVRGWLDRAARLARRGRALDRLGRPLRLLQARPAARPADELDLRPERLLPRRLLRLLALARRDDGGRGRGGDRLRVLGRARAAARLLRADAAADGRPGRRL